MFKKIIRGYIDFLKKHVDNLERAYEETYAETSKEFNKALNNIKRKNKQEFVNSAADWINQNMLKETGHGLPLSVRKKFGEHMFKIAEQRGDLDEFNNFKGEL